MEDSPAQGEIRRLLARFQVKDDQAASELLQRFYRELHEIAVRYMRQERSDHTLQPTALVHEAYIRLVGYDQLNWQGKSHFLGMAARTMRRILVEHARRKKAKKRGGGVTIFGLRDIDAGIEESINYDLVELNEALEWLEKLNQRQAQIIDLRFFGGLSVQESAEILGVSEKTVKNDVRFALAWLKSRLTP
ncbi:sigma-70 family RNA polymerase sigma factor [Candidatus Eisenbacteria bacterium]|uniref:Sigma-70 family RNA polymerase sigma factor n=1 Tax=Eiseniibacteriota bacterium TaxID=2212470 RepID=A0ABV6YLF5_UNCEI